MALALAGFHTLFNICNSIIMLVFLGWLVKLSIKSLPLRRKKDSKSRLKYIDNRVRSPELAIIELQSEVKSMAETLKCMMQESQKILNSTNENQKFQAIKRLRKLERKMDKMEYAISEYVIKLAKEKLTEETSKRLQSFLSMAIDLERAGDIFFNKCDDFEDKIKEKIWFTPDQRNYLNDMYGNLEDAIKIMISNLSASYDNVSLGLALLAEEKIDNHRDLLDDIRFENMDNFDFNIHGSMMWSKMYNSLEKIGDHVFNVSKSIVGQVESKI